MAACPIGQGLMESGRVSDSPHVGREKLSKENYAVISASARKACAAFTMAANAGKTSDH